MGAVVLAASSLLVCAAPTVEPLGPAPRGIFWGSAEDPPAAERHGLEPADTTNHYLASDEDHLHLFGARIANLGGGYLGVGADPAYLFIGWQRPELAWLIDYDPWIVQIHHVYRQFFVAATTPAAFLAFWDKENTEAAERLFNSSFLAPEQQRRMVWVYRAGRARIRAHLAELAERHTRAGVSSFLNDAETYRYVRGMVVAERVRPMSANLLDDHGLVGIGAAAKAMGVPIRVVYLSNAEEYWRYPAQYRANVQALPHDAKTLLLRTMAAQKSNGDYRYNLQPFERYLAWLRAPGVNRVYQIMDRAKIASPTEFPFTETLAWPSAPPPP